MIAHSQGASPGPQWPPEVPGFSGPHMGGCGPCWCECFSTTEGEGSSRAQAGPLDLLVDSDLQAKHCLSALIYSRVSIVQ